MFFLFLLCFLSLLFRRRHVLRSLFMLGDHVPRRIIGAAFLLARSVRLTDLARNGQL
jgi:hypothetical protein